MAKRMHDQSFIFTQVRCVKNIHEYYEIASLWAISASCLMALAAMGMAPASEASSAIGLNVKGSSTLSSSSSSAPPLAGAGGAEGSGAGGAGSGADSAWGETIFTMYFEKYE